MEAYYYSDPLQIWYYLPGSISLLGCKWSDSVSGLLFKWNKLEFKSFQQSKQIMIMDVKFPFYSVSMLQYPISQFVCKKGRTTILMHTNKQNH